MKIVQIIPAPMDMWMNIPAGSDKHNRTPVVCLALTEGGEIWPLTAADLGYRSCLTLTAQSPHKLRFERVAILNRQAAAEEQRIAVERSELQNCG